MLCVFGCTKEILYNNVVEQEITEYFMELLRLGTCRKDYFIYYVYIDFLRFYVPK